MHGFKSHKNIHHKNFKHYNTNIINITNIILVNSRHISKESSPNDSCIMHLWSMFKKEYIRHKIFLIRSGWIFGKYE